MPWLLSYQTPMVRRPTRLCNRRALVSCFHECLIHPLSDDEHFGRLEGHSSSTKKDGLFRCVSD